MSKFDDAINNDHFIEYLSNLDIPYFNDWLEIATFSENRPEGQELLNYYEEYLKENKNETTNIN